jgi:hypothetical protein
VSSIKFTQSATHFLRIYQRAVVPPATRATYPRPRRSLDQRLSGRVLTRFSGKMRPQVSDLRCQFRTGPIADLPRSRGHRRTTLLQTPRISRPIRRSLSPAVGLVPATESQINDDYESSGFIESNDKSSPAHAAPPRSCGDCPRDWRCVTTITNLRVLSNLTINPAPLTLPPRRSCGDCPRDWRCVTTITNLRVLSNLTINPAPLTLPPRRSCGDCPRDWGAV